MWTPLVEEPEPPKPDAPGIVPTVRQALGLWAMLTACVASWIALAAFGLWLVLP